MILKLPVRPPTIDLYRPALALSLVVYVWSLSFSPTCAIQTSAGKFLRPFKRMKQRCSQRLYIRNDSVKPCTQTVRPHKRALSILIKFCNHTLITRFCGLMNHLAVKIETNIFV